MGSQHCQVVLLVKDDKLNCSDILRKIFVLDKSNPTFYLGPVLPPRADGSPFKHRFSNSWRSNSHHQGSNQGQLQESDSHPLFHLLNFSLSSFLSFSSFSRFSFSALSFSLRRPRTFVSASRPETSELSWKWSNKKIGSVGRLVNSNTAVRIPPLVNCFVSNSLQGWYAA